LHRSSCRPADPHLRSGEILLGFAVRSRGRTTGRLQDIEIDAERWLVAALVLDTGVWIARTIELG